MHYKGLNRILTLLSMLSFLTAAGANENIHGIRVWSSPQSTRVVFDLSGNAKYKIFTLEDPYRVVIDFTDVDYRAKFNQHSLQGTPIANIRYSTQAKGKLRMVLDMRQPVKPVNFLLSPNAAYGHRLVVDLNGLTPVKVVKMQRNPTLRKFIVAIDPGHGGEDTGAIGHKHHLREKDVVLAVARKLEKLINAQPKMQAILIRNGDYYVGLRKRMELARAQGADLFISVHADSFKDPRVSGASVFILSEKGVSNEAARWLAERENRADLIGGVSLEDKSTVLASVLLDLSQTASQTASQELASHLISNLSKVTDLHHKTVQHAGFMVLKSPDIPSVLVELGFISNPRGEAKLVNAQHQQALATALLDGVKNYVAKRPTPVKYPEDWTVAKMEPEY